MADEDLEQLTRDELLAEVKKLRAGIRRHRDSTGHATPVILSPFRKGLGPRAKSCYNVRYDIPNQMHYDGTGPEGATLEFIAMGPAARNEAK
jgi:hypothetical protein